MCRNKRQRSPKNLGPIAFSIPSRLPFASQRPMAASDDELGIDGYPLGVCRLPRRGGCDSPGGRRARGCSLGVSCWASRPNRRCDFVQLGGWQKTVQGTGPSQGPCRSSAPPRTDRRRFFAKSTRPWSPARYAPMWRLSWWGGSPSAGAGGHQPPPLKSGRRGGLSDDALSVGLRGSTQSLTPVGGPRAPSAGPVRFGRPSRSSTRMRSSWRAHNRGASYCSWKGRSSTTSAPSGGTPLSMASSEGGWRPTGRGWAWCPEFYRVPSESNVSDAISRATTPGPDVKGGIAFSHGGPWRGGARHRLRLP